MKEPWQMTKGEYVPPYEEELRRMNDEMSRLQNEQTALRWTLKTIGKKGKLAVERKLKGAELDRYRELRRQIIDLDQRRSKLMAPIDKAIIDHGDIVQRA